MDFQKERGKKENEEGRREEEKKSNSKQNFITLVIRLAMND